MAFRFSRLVVFLDFGGRGVDRSSPLSAAILVNKDGINEEKNQVNSLRMVNIVQGKH